MTNNNNNNNNDDDDKKPAAADVRKNDRAKTNIGVKGRSSSGRQLKDDDEDDAGGGEGGIIIIPQPPKKGTGGTVVVPVPIPENANSTAASSQPTDAAVAGNHNDNDDSDDSVVQPGFMFVPGPGYTGTGIFTGYNSDHEDNNNTVSDEERAIAPAPESEIQCHVPSAYLVEDDDIEIAQAEEIKPFFHRKEGQLTIIIVGWLLASLAILMGIFLSREGNGVGDAAGSLEDEITEAPSMAPSFDPRPTLDIVRDRGVVNCGIEDAGQEGDVNFGEYNIDQCRGVAATIFGDPTKINLVIVGADDRYERLIGREVDVLFAGDTFTLEKLIREPTTGESLGFGYPYYTAAVVYLGLETYVKCANDQKRFDECKDLSICAVDDAEIRSLITSFFPASFITFGTFPLMEMSLKNEICNVLVSDTYRIYGSDDLQGDIANETYVMSDYHISRNLLSSVVRVDDDEWYDLVEGTRHASYRASQIGIRKRGGESQCSANSANNEISFYNAPQCVGNSVEVFQEHFSQIVLSAGPDAKLPAMDAPNFGSLECDTCEDVLKYGKLKEINERGLLNCAVFVDPVYNLTRSSLVTLVNVKFCEILAVAIFQGNSDAVNITYIDEMDDSAFPREFDVVAGVAWEDRVGFNTSNLGTMHAGLPYFTHDKHIYNGIVYDGVGSSLSFAHDAQHGDVEDPFIHLSTAAVTATVYAQRHGITRGSYFDMPLIQLLGDSITFMLRDVIMYAGNYDDIINEAIAVSDGATEVGWNTVVQNYALAAKTPVYYCDYNGMCPPCQYYFDTGYCISVGPIE